MKNFVLNLVFSKKNTQIRKHFSQTFRSPSVVVFFGYFNSFHIASHCHKKCCWKPNQIVHKVIQWHGVSIKHNRKKKSVFICCVFIWNKQIDQFLLSSFCSSCWIWTYMLLLNCTQHKAMFQYFYCSHWLGMPVQCLTIWGNRKNWLHLNNFKHND